MKEGSLDLLRADRILKNIFRLWLAESVATKPPLYSLELGRPKQWFQSFFFARIKHPGKGTFWLLIQCLLAILFLLHGETDGAEGCDGAKLFTLWVKMQRQTGWAQTYPSLIIIKVTSCKNSREPEIQDNVFNLARKKKKKHYTIPTDNIFNVWLRVGN